MTQEQKRIKLAEAAGWKHYHEDLWVSPNVTDFSELDCESPPDYCNDLNAVHEAEKVLLGDDIETWLTYDKYLAEGDTKFTWHTTAAQRAEALGKTLNLW
jgi:hypothetical protein